MKIVVYLFAIFIYFKSFAYEITISKKEYQQRVNSQKNRYDGIKELWASPYDLNGDGEKIAIFDGGRIYKDHIELKDAKIVEKTVAPISFHATSIASIIVANGINKDVKGIANKVTLYNFYYKKYNYDKAIKKALSLGINISNHSYFMDDFSNSAYTRINKNIDEIIYKNPQALAIFAAGNIKAKRSIIKDIPVLAVSKNILTIGALDHKMQKLMKLSPKGPTKDYRIKPDFVYRGLFVLVPDIDSKYTYHLYRGTSYASAFVSGIVVLISDAYHERFYKDITFDTLKSIMIVTADDVVKKGVDIFSGYGKPNAKKAVDFILDSKFKQKFLFDSIDQNITKSYTFNLKNDTHFKVAICWIDPPAKMNAKSTLVNDIDMTLYSKDKVYYPYYVDEKDLQVKKGINRHDNCEYIDEVLKKGEYKLVIKGYKIKKSQNFSLVTNTPFL